jgi:hypothetical protein
MNQMLVFLILIMSISLTANTCNRENFPIEKIANIYWTHSYEEDQGDTVVYRPGTFDFPPSRGREGFEFNDNGKFKNYVIAPTDGINTVKGSWKKLDEENTFLIEMDDNNDYDYPLPADFRLKIIHFDEQEEVLKILRF